jgi:hypothetical protein
MVGAAPCRWRRPWLEQLASDLQQPCKSTGIPDAGHIDIGDDLARDEPIEQHAERRQVLLDRWLRRGFLQDCIKISGVMPWVCNVARVKVAAV